LTAVLGKTLDVAVEAMSINDKVNLVHKMWQRPVRELQFFLSFISCSDWECSN
jgi:hypothetical protein